MINSHPIQSQNQQTFINSTGQTIHKIYMSTFYIVPGKKYPSQTSNNKQSHSLFHYGRRLLSFLLSLQIHQFFTLIKFRKIKTLHSMYSQESLAILSNSINLHNAICKAQEYNIPLIQILILSPAGEKIIKERIILNFQIAHLINQNFVLYGDWQENIEITDCLGKLETESQGSCDRREGLYFRRGEVIYGFISLNKINCVDDNVVLQNLIKLRNSFYTIQNEIQQELKQQAQNDMNSQPSSTFEADISHFGAMAMQNHHNHQLMEDPIFQDNFNDSDNEAQIQEMQGQ